MYKGNSFLAIIPARGGSKRIPRKNIKNLAGKPLIAWTIDEAKKSKYLDRIVLSSEDKEIMETAKKFGCEVPFIRPADLAKDDTPGTLPILHAIESIDSKYDFIVLLQPTSPLRKSQSIDNAIDFIINQKADSIVSLTKVTKSPEWMFCMNEDKTIDSIFNNDNKRKQEMTNVFQLNGAIYIIKTDYFKKIKSLIGEKTLGFIMNYKESIDIDNMSDWEYVEFLLAKENV